MINLFKQELGEMHSFFKHNYREAVVLCMSTLFLVLAIYRPIGSSLVVNYLVYYAILPVFTILIILRKNPLDFGLRLGNYKLWGFYVAITVLIAIPVLYIGSLFSSVGFSISMTKNYQLELTVSLLALIIGVCLNYVLIP